MFNSLLYFIPTVLIGLVFPIYAILTADQMRTLLLAAPEKKVVAYQSTLIMQLILVGLILIALYVNQDDIRQIGLTFSYQPYKWLLLLGAATLAFGILQLRRIDAAEATRLNKKNKDLLYILPVSEQEFQWTIFLSFVVGISEEIIFRGFLFWQIYYFLPLLPAIVLTNIIFALCHFSTKRKNMVYAFLLGLLWSVIYYYTDSLWWPMLMHVVVDLYAMVEAYKVAQVIEE